LVFAAVLITSVTFSAPAEPDLAIKEQSLIQSHLLAVSQSGTLPRRLTRQE
jgi:hypothetical protein